MHSNFQQFKKWEKGENLSFYCPIYLHITALITGESEKKQLIINNANIYTDAVSFDSRIQCTFAKNFGLPNFFYKNWGLKSANLQIKIRSYEMQNL